MAASPMWNCPAAPRLPRRLACAACGPWKRPAISKAITPILNGKALGFSVTGFIFVGLASQKDADLKHFEERVRGWPEVRECHMLSGEVDFILKCVAADLSAFQSFVTETVTAERNVASVKSSLVIHPTKIEPGVPIVVPGKYFLPPSVRHAGKPATRTSSPADAPPGGGRKTGQAAPGLLRSSPAPCTVMRMNKGDAIKPSCG